MHTIWCRDLDLLEEREYEPEVVDDELTNLPREVAVDDPD
jgi:hypothetical protein